MFLFFLFDTSYTYEPFQGKTFVSSIWQYFSSSVLAQKLCWTWRLFLQLLFIACITTIPQMVRLHLCQVLCKKNIKQAHLPPPPAPSTPSPTSQFPVSCNHFRIPLFLFVFFHDDYMLHRHWGSFGTERRCTVMTECRLLNRHKLVFLSSQCLSVKLHFILIWLASFFKLYIFFWWYFYWLMYKIGYIVFHNRFLCLPK